MKRLVLAVALLATPLSAWAQCSGHSEQAAMTCMEGTTWDPVVNSCVPIVTG